MSDFENRARKRVAVLVDNVCLADNRVIRSSEFTASEGYEVRVFCRDRRKSVGNSFENGVFYQRNWIPGLIYARTDEEQAASRKTYMRMPGRMGSRVTFLVEAFLFFIAFRLKAILDDYRRVNNQGNKAFNREFNSLRKKSERKIDKLVAKRDRDLRHTILRKRIRFKLVREKARITNRLKRWARKGWWGLKMAVPVLLFGPLILLALAYLVVDRAIQRFREPPGRVQTAAKRVARNPEAPKPRFHNRLLRFVLDDKNDKAYVNRIVKLKAARIFESTRDEIVDYAPDLIHAHDFVNLPVGIMLGELTGAKVIYDAHEFETSRDKPHDPFWMQEVIDMEREYARRADGVITVSPALATKLEDLHGIPEVTVIMNTPDHTHRREPDMTLREELGLPDDVRLGLYVGGLKITRGLPFFLEAAAKIPGLHIAACGPRTAVAEQAFAELAEELGIADRFHMVGPEPIESLLGYIRGCDFSIMPTQNLGVSYVYAMPNKFFESMLAGIPILVGANIVEMADVVSRHGLGLLVDQTDPDDIATNMRKILARGPAITAYNRQQDLAAVYGWEAQTRRLSALYSRVLDDSVTAPQSSAKSSSKSDPSSSGTSLKSAMVS